MAALKLYKRKFVRTAKKFLASNMQLDIPGTSAVTKLLMESFVSSYMDKFLLEEYLKLLPRFEP